jgi:hypothetical protein
MVCFCFLGSGSEDEGGLRLLSAAAKVLSARGSWVVAARAGVARGNSYLGMLMVWATVVGCWFLAAAVGRGGSTLLGRQQGRRWWLEAIPLVAVCGLL